MTVYLFVWVVQAAVGYKGFPAWVETGAYDGFAACHRAAQNLRAEHYRCVSKATGEIK